MNVDTSLMDKIVSLAKRRGFVFPGSEIYGGLANSWDYGPLGVELKNNLRDWWWQRFVQSRPDMVGLDAAVIMNPEVWQASGHVSNFKDAMVDCKQCRARHRADHLIEEYLAGHSGAQPTHQSESSVRDKLRGAIESPGDPIGQPSASLQDDNMKVEGKSVEELNAIIQHYQIPCPNCGTKGTFTDARKFSLLFQTSIGSVEGEKSVAYLRGEIAQAMFVNFKNVLDTTRKRLPFGIASVGKAFRNEITPGNFIYRTLEFDLMEFEYFIRAEEWEEQFEYWLKEQKSWLQEMGFDMTHTRVREHTKEELSHYSTRTADIEYQTPFGWKEMFGLAYRTDFDLKNHMEKSGADLRYTDPDTQERFIPHAIEPTFGLTRLVLMVLLEAYREEGGGDEKRAYLKLHPKLAPYKAAVFPLLKNKPELVDKARGIYQDLLKLFPTAWDERGNIGKRYYAQDEIGTPFCITVDFDSLEKGDVTVRDRDTTQQERVKIEELREYVRNKI